MPHSRLASPSATIAVLARHGLHTRKALGQHFLVDDNIVGRIIDLAASSAWGSTSWRSGPVSVLSPMHSSLRAPESPRSNTMLVSSPSSLSWRRRAALCGS